MCERERDIGMVTKCVCRRGVDGGKRFSNGVPITGRERQSVWGGEVSLTLWAHTHHPPPSLHPALHHSAPPPLLPHTLHHLVPDLPAHTYLFSLPGVRATGHRLWQTTTHTHPSPSYTLTVRTQRPHCSSTFLLFDIIKKKILTHVFTSTCKTLVHIHTHVMLEDLWGSTCSCCKCPLTRNKGSNSGLFQAKESSYLKWFSWNLTEHFCCGLLTLAT